MRMHYHDIIIYLRIIYQCLFMTIPGRGHLRSQRPELLSEPAAEPALQGPPLAGHPGGW